MKTRKKSTAGRGQVLPRVGCQHPDLPLLSSMGLREVEMLILEIVRSLCAGYEYDNLAYWEHAFQVAEEHMGEIDGPSFVSRCVMLLRALRAERAGGFRYMSVECIHISEAELDLMALVRAGSSTQKGDQQLSLAAGKLATINNPSKLMTAARALGAMCIRFQRLQEFEKQYAEQVPPLRLH